MCEQLIKAQHIGGACLWYGGYGTANLSGVSGGEKNGGIMGLFGRLLSPPSLIYSKHKDG